MSFKIIGGFRRSIMDSVALWMVGDDQCDYWGFFHKYKFNIIKYEC